MKKWIAFLCIGTYINVSGQETTSMVNCTEYSRYILTHKLVPAGPVPTVFDPNVVYPYISYSETANRPEPVKCKFINLENKNIKQDIHGYDTFHGLK